MLSVCPGLPMNGDGSQRVSVFVLFFSALCLAACFGKDQHAKKKVGHYNKGTNKRHKKDKLECVLG